MDFLRRRTAPCTFLVAAALLAACSDDGEESPATSASATSTSTGAGSPTSTTTTGTDTSTGTGGEGGGGGGGGGTAGVTIPGLEGAVTATTDANGVLHLQCEVDDDCFAALGYFHSQNRFFFMDFVRNLVRGSLGGLVEAGAIVLEQDYANRHFFTTREGEPLEQALYDQASDRTKGHFDAYTRGVNAWIADMRAGENGATLTTEYDFALIVKENIRDWEPADSAAVGLYVLNDLSNNSGDEIAIGELFPAFDPAFAGDLFSGESVFDAFTAPGGEAPAAAALLPPSVAHRLHAARSPLTDAMQAMSIVGSGRHEPGEVGSNNWLVGPDRSASGNAVVANDPHLLLTNPSIWFAAEIDAKSAGEGDYHMAGGTFPGLPAVLIGHNEDIAWGVTTAYWDLADVYLEELSADGSAVIFEGDEVPILERDFEFADAAAGDTKVRTFRWVPHHGPIVAEDPEAGTAVSIRWRGHDGGTDLDAFFAMGRAASVDEARAGLADHATCANQNFIVADRDGNIGWFPFVEVPSRPWASPELPPWLPLPGDGSAEWGEPVSKDELPQLLNPPGGAIATANQDMTGAWSDGDPTNDGQDAIQARGRGEGARQQRILDLLADGGDEHSPATLLAMQGDTFSLFGELVVPVLVDAAGAGGLSAEAEDVVTALEAWDFTCPTGLDGSDPAGEGAEAETDAAVGCTAFHVAWYALVAEAVGDEAEAAGVSVYGGNLVARALREPEALATGEQLWDDVGTDGTVETREDIALRALEVAGARLAALGDADAWRWGRVHTLTLRSIYDNFGVTDYNEGPYAAPGGLNTVNVANPRDRVLPEDGADLDLGFGSGPSIRLVTEVTPDGPRMQLQLPGGADLHRESEFYNNLLPSWLVNEPVDVPFGAGAVEDPASVVEVNPG